MANSVSSGPSSVLLHAEPQTAPLPVRRISLWDLREALDAGLEDFWEKPSHILFLGLIYPIAGLVLGRLAIGYDVLYLVFPIVAGFAIVGPVVAIGLYEISRRREHGLDTSWARAFDVLRSPAIGAILAVGLVLALLFLAWLWSASILYSALYGDTVPASISAFFTDVVTTTRGWTMIILGHAIGFVFAALAFVVSVVTFPLLLDRHVHPIAAVRTSIAAVAANPVPMAAWALIVAVALIIGTVPAFVGLALIVPILGHATWHLYRAVVPDSPDRGQSAA